MDILKRISFEIFILMGAHLGAFAGFALCFGGVEMGWIDMKDPSSFNLLMGICAAMGLFGLYGGWRLHRWAYSGEGESST